MSKESEILRDLMNNSSNTKAREKAAQTFIDHMKAKASRTKKNKKKGRK